MAAPRKLNATEPSDVKPSKPKIMIFGKPGVGKSWSALDFPSVYYIDTEGGANLGHYADRLKKSGGVYFGPSQGSNDFSAVTEEIITLATTQHRFRTLVIDSFSQIFNTQVSADHERMEKAGRDMEKTFGAEKKGAINWVRRWLRWFDRMDMNVVLICHEKDAYVDGKLTGVAADAWVKMEYALHLNLHITKAGPIRRARVVKSRLLGFPDAEVFDWNYAAFAERYGKDIIESSSKPVDMATAEQVKTFTDLLAAVKVDPKVLEKWEDNGDAADLSSEDLGKRIQYLKSLLPKAGV